MRSLYATLIASIPAFGNVGALIGLILFMYAYVGVYLFGKLKWHVGINEAVNFRNFPQAIVLLLRVATMDNWCGGAAENDHGHLVLLMFSIHGLCYRHCDSCCCSSAAAADSAASGICIK